MSKLFVSKVIDFVAKKPVRIQQLYTEFPNLTHCQIKTKLVRKLIFWNIAQMKLNTQDKHFYLHIKKMPTKEELKTYNNTVQLKLLPINVQHKIGYTHFRKLSYPQQSDSK